MPFPAVMHLKFDPQSDPDVAEVFADDIARTFYLTWRCGHIVDKEYFLLSCLRVAANIRVRQPKTERELFDCIPCSVYNISERDVLRFVPEYLPYVLGQAQIGYEIITPETPAKETKMIQMQNIFRELAREREYQDAKWGPQPPRGHEVGSWLGIMRVLLTEAETAWAKTQGDDAALQRVVEIGAVAVACLQQYGVVTREELAANAAEDQAAKEAGETPS
jgi:hypothetical protein